MNKNSTAKSPRSIEVWIARGAFVALTIFVFLLYQPALNGPFVFDDGPNLVRNKPLHLTSLNPDEFLTGIQAVKAGPFGRPVAYASFALNYYFFGPQAYSFKMTNVIIHVINGLCIFILTGILLRSYRLTKPAIFTKRHIRWVALAATALWLLHPLALTPVLYVVQRMTSLATLFSLLTFIFYFSGRLKQFTGQSAIPQFFVAFGICAPLAVLSKDNAILIPYFILVTDWTLLQFKARSKSDRLFIQALLLALVIPLVVGLSVWDNFFDSLMAGYTIKPFTLYQHVLTETRVLWFYLKLVFIPYPADFGLYHDDFTLSKGLLQPFTTITSIVGLIILATGAVVLRKKLPVVSFAVLFFLVGHSIESSIFSLEIVHEHRNYLPMYGMIFMVAYYGLHPRLIQHGGWVVIAGFILLVGLFSSITLNRVLDWRNLGSLSLSLAEHHPHSARSNYEAGRLMTRLIEDDIQSAEAKHYNTIARRYLTRAYQSDEFNPAGLFGILYLDSLTGNPTDMDIVARLKRRLSKHPILPASATSFSSLQKCHERRACDIKIDILIGLYESALSNKLADNKTRASLFNELAILKLEQRNATAAIELFKQSIALTPAQPQLRFNLIHVLITSGQLEDARQELVSVREKFSHSREPDKLIRLERMYADAARNSSD